MSCVHVRVHIHTAREREREPDRERWVYIYIMLCTVHSTQGQGQGMGTYPFSIYPFSHSRSRSRSQSRAVWMSHYSPGLIHHFFPVIGIVRHEVLSCHVFILLFNSTGGLNDNVKMLKARFYFSNAKSIFRNVREQVDKFCTFCKVWFNFDTRALLSYIEILWYSLGCNFLCCKIMLIILLGFLKIRHLFRSLRPSSFKGKDLQDV